MENKPTGIEAGKLVLENIYSRFERLTQIYTTILEEKTKILELNEPIFICGEDYFFFKNNFKLIAGEEDFLFYESEFLLKFIEELKFVLFNSDVLYSIVEIDNMNVVEVSVNINSKNHPILYINPYYKQMETIDNEYIILLNKEIKRFQKEIKNLEEEEKKIELAIKNPIFGAENPLQMIDATVRKKKKIEEMKHKLVEISNAIMDYNLSIRECENLIQEFNITNVQADSEREIIENKLKKSFNFININEEKQVEMTIDEMKIEFFDISDKKEGLREINNKKL